jgi:hypothetical protein
MASNTTPLVKWMRKYKKQNSSENVLAGQQDRRAKCSRRYSYDPELLDASGIRQVYLSRRMSHLKKNTVCIEHPILEQDDHDSKRQKDDDASSDSPNLVVSSKEHHRKNSVDTATTTGNLKKARPLHRRFSDGHVLKSNQAIIEVKTHNKKAENSTTKEDKMSLVRRFDTIEKIISTVVTLVICKPDKIIFGE